MVELKYLLKHYVKMEWIFNYGKIYNSRGTHEFKKLRTAYKPKNKSLISNFFSKNYGWPYDERFEDSIWYHGSDEFESECIELINEEGQDLQDQLFVIKEHYNTFLNELSIVLKVLFEKEDEVAK